MSRQISFLEIVIRRSTKLTLLVFITAQLCLFGTLPALADDEPNLLDMSLEELMGMDFSEKKPRPLTIYGYMSANVEKVFGELSISDGQTVKTNAPHEWSVPHFHIFMRAHPTSTIETFVNIATEEMEVRNMWGNIGFHRAFQIRLGKVYRRFGLFNAKIDEVPTYLGIEPPELFDTDHLLLPRLTSFMIHGDVVRENATYSYALCTDNGEAGPTDGVIPLGWDVRAKIHGNVLVGVSGYVSDLGSSTNSPSQAVGEGSVDGGVLPWMAGDDYEVYGGFAEIQIKRWLIKAAYWEANHTFCRDASTVLDIAIATDLNDNQKERFFGASADVAASSLTEDDVVQSGRYRVKTGYVRLGYFIYSDHGTFAPFVFFDWMHNPETIEDKELGGDKECGIADDGLFYKYTVGISYKPVDEVAIKLDHSAHIQKYNGRTESYPEIRFDVSYMFR
ncbi:MAG: hypothetical protein JSU65_13370 [Candidatus Zixiibacteriota bacterium]|nr:MAG: hypothetical protein JSU65_13370 [candidate division Zixibacteria bacterium]